MKKPYKFVLLLLTLTAWHVGLTGQVRYDNFKTLSQKIATLEREYPGLCTVKSLVKSAGNKDIWAIEIGTGKKEQKPAIAVVGGVEGSYILGSELAFGFATTLLNQSDTPSIKSMLDKVTFYILPDVSPDAVEQYFSDLKYERNINAHSTDDDRDFVSDEDPFEDLNNDGLITLIRVKDPEGTFVISSKDNRVMIPADLSNGEIGQYKVMTEGIDNDKDGNFNEDGSGGVDFNKNFTYDYEAYGLNAGLYPVSEPEVKAVADFLYDRFNIYAVFTFGPQDNLGKPLLASDRPSSDRRITSIMKTDEVINKLVSDKYHEITGIKGSPPVKEEHGNFADWAYYHYGRYSFSTPGWWIPVEKGKNTEVAFLKYADENDMKNVFVPWERIDHPDFKGKVTEVGGIKPFMMTTPPADSLNILIGRNFKFITEIAEMHPELEFLNVNIENAGDNIYRVSLSVHNRGIFSTCAEIGERNIWTRIMILNLEPGKGQQILSGDKVTRMERLEGNHAEDFSWLISGKGTLKVTAGAVNTGIITSNIELK